MASDVQICNRALQIIGATTRITALTDSNQAARDLNTMYAPVRDAELRKHPWSFALARVVLAPSASAPVFEFDYAFQLPSDFLRLHPDYEYQAETDWQIEGNQLLTNDGDTLYLRYVKQVTDANLFDALFREALAAQLAYQMAPPVTKNNTTRQDALNAYNLTIREAKKVNAIEKVSAKTPDASWITARK